ncbi:MAG: SDR family oxidoreductase [Bacteroidales bacterium]|nr:SDR family oxidoreductase [Bacteroidales bacterium]
MEPKCYDRLKGQPAIVTGANSGIGKAVAVQLAKEGAKVVVNYIGNEEATKEVISEIRDFGGEVMAYKADVSKEEEVVAMFRKTIETYGTVHILVNNAGIQKDAAIDEMSLEEWQKVINVNLTGQFLCSREAIKEFKRRGIDEHISNSAGKIICMSSVHDVIPWAGHANYAASKGGIMLLMKSMAQEVAPEKIRINSIGPGAIKTPINESAWSTTEAEQKLLKLIPQNRVGEPADIARAAVWLVSDESEYVNGVTLYVDGGMTLYPGFATGG